MRNSMWLEILISYYLYKLYKLPWELTKYVIVPRTSSTVGIIDSACLMEGTGEVATATGSRGVEPEAFSTESRTESIARRTMS